MTIIVAGLVLVGLLLAGATILASIAFGPSIMVRVMDRFEKWLDEKGW